MQNIDDQLHLVLSLMISSDALTTTDDAARTAHAVVRFSFQEDGVRYDGEISLRLTIEG